MTWALVWRILPWIPLGLSVILMMGYWRMIFSDMAGSDHGLTAPMLLTAIWLLMLAGVLRIW